MRPTHGEVFGEQRRQPRPQARESVDVRCVQQPLARRRHVEQQLGIAPHRREPDVGELLHRLHALVLSGVIEPAGTDRGVGLGGPPHRAVRVAVLQGGDHRVTRRAGIRHRGGIHRGPVGIARRAAFVAAPAYVGTSIGKHHRVRLQAAHQSEDARPVIDLAAPVGSLAIGAVEPHLGDRPVVCEQLGQLIAIEVVVARRIPVHWRVAIPRRQVQPGPQPLGATGVGELLHHVAGAAAPRASRHGVLGHPAGPQAEAVVVLGGENERSGPSGFGGTGPLSGVEGAGGEDGGILASVAPLTIGEGVDAEMQEQRQLFPLPRELGR